MSYARMGVDGSDVYVYLYASLAENGYVAIECASCGTTPRGESHPEYSYAGMIAHLRQHQAVGHCVPEYAFIELTADMASDHLTAPHSAG